MSGTSSHSAEHNRGTKDAANNPADFDLKMNMFGEQSGSGAQGTQGLQDEMTKMMGG